MLEINITLYILAEGSVECEGHIPSCIVNLLWYPRTWRCGEDVYWIMCCGSIGGWTYWRFLERYFMIIRRHLYQRCCAARRWLVYFANADGSGSAAVRSGAVIAMVTNAPLTSIPGRVHPMYIRNVGTNPTKRGFIIESTAGGSTFFTM